MHYFKTLLLIAILTVSALSVEAQSSKGKIKENATLLTFDPEVKVGKLKNGLTYYIRRNTEPKKKAELYLVVKVGSTAEDDDQAGLAHFTEHMAFNGTRDFPKNELINYLQKAGVRFGADLNAYTSFDETVYQLPIPTDSAELFAKGFTILANWAAYVSFENDDIDQERGVIIEEDRMRGKDADERMRNQLIPVMLKDSRYAERLPIGKIDVIKNFKHETLKRFYADWYRPDLQAVIAVGDFDVKTVEKLIAANFSGLKTPKKKKEPVAYPLPDNAQPLVKIVTDPEFTGARLTVMYKHKGYVSKTTQDLRRTVMTSLINRMFVTRMEEVKQSGKAPFLLGTGSYNAFQGGIGDAYAFALTVVPKTAEELKASFKAVMAEGLRMKRFGFTAPELEQAKKGYLANVQNQHNERNKQTSRGFAQQYVRSFTKGAISTTADFRYNFYQQEIPKIRLEEVNAIASGWVGDENRIAIIEGSQKDTAALPSPQNLLSWLNEPMNDITAYEYKTNDLPLMEKQPKAGSIIQSKSLAPLGAVEWKLSNGVTVTVKPTDFKDDEVNIHASRLGGFSLLDDNELLTASMASELVRLSGIGSHDKVQLSRLLAGKTVNISPFISDYQESVSGYSSKKDIETLFQIMHLYFTKPRKDTVVFRTIIDGQRINLTARKVDPGSIYQDTINAVLSGRHPRAVPSTVADLAGVKADRAHEIYTQRFANVAGFHFIIVGNVDTVQLKELAATYLASLPSSGVEETYKDHHIKPLQGTVIKNVYKGLEDKVTVSLYYTGSYTFSQQQNLMLSVLSSSLRIRLTERLREKESGVYSPQVSVNYGKIPEARYAFTIRFNCAQAQAERLIAAAKEEIEKMRSEGALQEDIQKFVAQEKQQLEVRQRNNNYWLGLLSEVHHGLRSPLYPQEYPASLNAITKEDSKTAAALYFKEENIKQIVLFPEQAGKTN